MKLLQLILETPDPQDGKAAPYGSGFKPVTLTKESLEQLVWEVLVEKDDRCTRIAKSKYDVWPSAYASGAVVRCRKGDIWKDVKEVFNRILQEDESLRKWFGRKGSPGKAGGWVDCNAPIRKDGKVTGYKTCGRQEDEKRAKYPACRPTAAKCKDKGKGKTWGKTKNESLKKNSDYQNIKEAVTATEVICDNCGWNWKIADGGKDVYLCHKCYHDNTPDQMDEKCWKGYKKEGMKTMFGKKYPNCIKRDTTNNK